MKKIYKIGKTFAISMTMILIISSYGVSATEIKMGIAADRHAAECAESAAKYVGMVASYYSDINDVCEVAYVYAELAKVAAKAAKTSVDVGAELIDRYRDSKKFIRKSSKIMERHATIAAAAAESAAAVAASIVTRLFNESYGVPHGGDYIRNVAEVLDSVPGIIESAAKSNKDAESAIKDMEKAATDAKAIVKDLEKRDYDIDSGI